MVLNTLYSVYRFARAIWSNPLDGEMEVMEYLIARVSKALDIYKYDHEAIDRIARATILEYLLLKDAKEER
jgi:hypothetical protein